MNLANLIILSTRNLSKAPRIHREIQALKGHYNLFFFGEGNQQIKDATFYNFYTFRSFFDKIQNGIVNKLVNRLGFNFHKSYTRFERFIKENKVKTLIIHEDTFLPLACQIKKKYGVKIIFNAHEYHPLEFEDLPGWLEKEGRLHYDLYQSYLKNLDLLVNVSEGIREKCLNEFQVDSIVIPNAPYLLEVSPPKINTSGIIRMIHHGVILPSRELEHMISIASELGNGFSLDIMGVISKDHLEYYNYLLNKAAKTTNVTFIPSVPYQEIIPFIRNYDVGLFYLKPVNFNYKHALPNKLFEFMHANLAIAISPSPEMKKIVEQYSIGVVSKDFTVESMVAIISSLDHGKIATYKKNTEIASNIENAENYQKIFLNQIVSLD